jgi:hypothetical protein
VPSRLKILLCRQSSFDRLWKDLPGSHDRYLASVLLCLMPVFSDVILEHKITHVDALLITHNHADATNG